MDNVFMTNKQAPIPRKQNQPASAKDFTQQQVPYEKIAGQSAETIKKLQEHRIDG